MKRVSDLKKKPIELICPRCSNFIPNNEQPGLYPGAMSRWNDRSVEVCSNCGQDEAMIQFTAAQRGANPQRAVHPIHGERMWDNPPAGLK